MGKEGREDMKQKEKNDQMIENLPLHLHILIVSSNQDEVKELVAHLTKRGDVMLSVANNIEKAKKIFEKHLTINMILIDLSMEKGVEFYKSLQRKVPVIYFGEKVDESIVDEVATTEPLCYLVKPLNYDELEISLRLALYKLSLQQSQSTLKEKITFGTGFEFDALHNTLRWHTKTWKLGSKKAKLLKLLLDAKGQYVSFEILEQSLYPTSPPGESSLRTLIYRLRKLLDAGMIETQRNYGVRLKVRR